VLSERQVTIEITLAKGTWKYDGEASVFKKRDTKGLEAAKMKFLLILLRIARLDQRNVDT